jgi:two-component system cell cycle sensor histidine kinase/response regulator CckA
MSVRPAPIGKISVLLVEDEPAFRTLLALTLKQDGYHVIEAADGREAVVAAQKAVHVDLVVTDIRMPLMDGITMMRRLRRVQPDVPVLFVTGFPSDVKTPAPNSRVLEKPFVRDDLMRAVYELTGA